MMERMREKKKRESSKEKVKVQSLLRRSSITKILESCGGKPYRIFPHAVRDLHVSMACFRFLLHYFWLGKTSLLVSKSFINHIEKEANQYKAT